MMTDSFMFSSNAIMVEASDDHRDYAEKALRTIYGHDLTDTGSMGFAGARSILLERRPNVLGLLINESALMATHIPRGPFSGTPVLPSVVLARRALTLMQEG